MARKRIHIVSNTHWDREHRHAFQETRYMLVECLDKLIDIMENDPEFRFFTLDGQSVPLEDYLEVRPQMAPRLEKLIRDGRLQIGPWYSLPDHFSAHPEALVRNLLIGDRVCRDFGGVTKFGYSIFSFSQIAQLPQLYAGFGIDNLIFYKLYPQHLLEKAEFWWKSPDGTTALCSRLGPRNRSNFFFEFTVPVILGGDPHRGEWEVRYTGDRKITRLVDRVFEHNHATELEPDIRIRSEKIDEYLPHLIASCDQESFSDDILLAFDGCDFTAPLEELPEAIRQANDKAGEEVELVHSTPLAYFQEFREHADLGQLPVVEGEMRFGPLSRQHTELMATAVRLMHGLHRAETMLIHCAEPLTALMNGFGYEYPQDLLRYAWKELLKNQAHDTPHGIGVPKITRDAQHRIEQVEELAGSLTRRAMQALVSRVNTDTCSQDDILLLVYNPTAYARDDVIRLTVDLPAAEHVSDFYFEDMQGKRLTHYEYTRHQANLASINNENRPKGLFVEQATIDLEVCGVPAFGYRTFRLIRTINPGGRAFQPFPDPIEPTWSLAQPPNVMDNGLLRVEIADNGTLTVTDKTTGYCARGLNLFLDTGDVGDMWIHRKPRHNQTLSNVSGQVAISLVEESGLSATYRIDLTLPIPVSATQNREGRSEQARSTLVRTEVTLRKHARRLDFKTMLNNRCRDHMLTVRFPSGLQTDALVSDVAFEVRQRPIEYRTDHYGVRGPELRRQPKGRFIDISDGQVGMAIFAKGQNEYEPKKLESTTVDLSLMRSMTQRFPIHEGVFCTFEQEESQSQGEHLFEYALFFHEGDYKGGHVQVAAQQYITPVLAAEFGKGRAGADLPLDACSLLRVDNALTNVSAVKRAEDSSSLVVRLNNPSDVVLHDSLRLYRTPSRARLCNLNEEPGDELPLSADGAIEVQLAPRRIETIMIDF